MLGAALVVGGDGLLGGALARQLETDGVRVMTTSRHAGTGTLSLDLATKPQSWRLPDQGLDVAFLCAAVTGQGACEREPAATRLINVERTCALADALLARGVFLVFPSTDLVSAAPLPVYAQQKREVEAHLAGKSAAVVRLGKVLAPRAGILADWIEALRRARTVTPYSNARFAPVPLALAVEALADAARLRRAGLTTVCGAPPISYSDAITFLACRLHLDTSLIRPVEAKPMPAAAVAQAGVVSADVWTTLESLYVKTATS
jgi:dTDP-4-dehydrorhamnose reductase